MGMGWRFRLSPYGDFRPEKAQAGKAPARVFFASRIALSAAGIVNTGKGAFLRLNVFRFPPFSHCEIFTRKIPLAPHFASGRAARGGRSNQINCRNAKRFRQIPNPFSFRRFKLGRRLAAISPELRENKKIRPRNGIGYEKISNQALSAVGDFSGDGGRRGHAGAHQHGTARRAALPALEVAV